MERFNMNQQPYDDSLDCNNWDPIELKSVLELLAERMEKDEFEDNCSKMWGNSPQLSL